MKTVVLVTGHYYKSKRKAGFHWLANAYKNRGWKVIFVTAPISYISWIRKDYRFEYPIFKEANEIIEVEPNIYSYILFTPYHPARTRINILDRMLEPIYNLYKETNLGILSEHIKQADLIIFESTPALLLFKKFKQLNSHARYVYRVSDDTRVLKLHPIVIKFEEEIIEEFDLVSVPSFYIYNRFNKQVNKLKLQYHGINKKVFDRDYRNPYENTGKNAVFVGNSRLCFEFLDKVAQLFPNINFHIIGPFPKKVQKENIYYYGEVPFEQTVPYIKYADIGLHTLEYEKGVESFTDSLKVHQYTYCRLPIVAPNFLKSNRTNFFYYEVSDNRSIKAAINDALNCDRGKIDNSIVNSWEDLSRLLEDDIDNNSYF
jgi:2-beta-glucuronyltransferase